MNNNSKSHDRRVNAYLKPTTFKLVQNYIDINKISESQAVNELLEKIPDKVKQEILNKR